MTDDTQSPNSEPGDPQIDLSAANLGERANWWTPDGMHEISTGGTRLPFSYAEMRHQVDKWLSESPELYEIVWRWLVARKQAGS